MSPLHRLLPSLPLLGLLVACGGGAASPPTASPTPILVTFATSTTLSPALPATTTSSTTVSTATVTASAVTSTTTSLAPSVAATATRTSVALAAISGSVSKDTITTRETRASTMTVTPGAALRVTGTGSVGLRLRDAPNGTPVEVVADGAMLTAVGDPTQQAGGSTWVHVKTADGRTGWVAAQYVRTAS